MRELRLTASKPGGGMPTPRSEVDMQPCGPGSLNAGRQTTHVVQDSPGILQRIGGLFAPRTPVESAEGNRLWERLPPEIAVHVFCYLADPFERAALATTCKVINRLLTPFKPEFALFRTLIRNKKSLDVNYTSEIISTARMFLDLFSGDRWTDGIRRRALRDVFHRLVAMYPHIPERVFHEAFPLFERMRMATHVPVMRGIVDKAMGRSPLLATRILIELAQRMRFAEDRSQFYDALLEYALPLWRDPNTCQEADTLIGCLAWHFDSYSKSIDMARWKRIFERLPEWAHAESDSVIGLALYAARAEGRAPPKGGLTDLLTKRVGFPGTEAMEAFRKARVKDWNDELKIFSERERRFRDGPLHAKRLAREAQTRSYEPLNPACLG